MLQLRFKGEFLDLKRDQDGELTKNSPLFALDQAMAEYSTPLSLAASDKTARLIQFLFFDLTQKSKAKIDVDVFTNGSYRFRGTLIIDGATIDRVHPGEGQATCYLLTGISDFFSVVKDRRLTSLALGGERTGSQAMFDNSLNFTEDFVCQPCSNEYWDGNSDAGSIEWMNQLDANGSISPFSPVAPFVKLEYLLTQIFAENGWQLDTSGLNDVDWKRLILFTAARIDRITTNYAFSFSILDYVPSFTVISPLYFSLASLMPASVTIADFVTALCNRFGWAPVCDANQRICYMTALKEVSQGVVKDWTRYRAKSTGTDFSKDARIFQFKNTFEGGDQLPASPSFEGMTQFGSAFADKSHLPDVSQNYSSYYDDKYAYTTLENQYWHVELNDTTNKREWVVFADNIYDNEVPGATDTIETKCTTLPNYLKKWRTAGGVDYYGYFPTCRQSRFEKWGIRLLFYHGKVKEQKEDGSPGTVSYPFASAGCNAPNTLPDLGWSNVYSHLFLQTDKGIVPFWFKAWLQVLANAEEPKRRYNLPFHEWVRFRWTDVILDNHKTYLVKTTTEHLVYKGYIECTMQPLLIAEQSAGTAGIWLSMGYENVVHTAGSWGYIYQDADHGDVVIYAWSDAAGTIPYYPGSLPAKYKGYMKVNNGTFNPVGDDTTINLLTHRTLVYRDVFKSGTISSSGDHWESDYRLLPAAGYNII